VVDAKPSPTCSTTTPGWRSRARHYGVLATAGIDIPAIGKLNAQASYAAQVGLRGEPVLPTTPTTSTSQAGIGLFGMTLTAGYESSAATAAWPRSRPRSASLHAFNGWADMFLTTPATGLRDYYATVGTGFGVPFLPGLQGRPDLPRVRRRLRRRDYGSELGRLARLQARPRRPARQIRELRGQRVRGRYREILASGRSGLLMGE
jgi:hypothetical protein